MPNQRTNNRVPQNQIFCNQKELHRTKVPNGFILVHGFLNTEANFLFFYKVQGGIELHTVAELHKLKFWEFLRVQREISYETQK